MLKFELKNDMAAYLQGLPGAGPRTLADLIAFDARTPRETVLFDQDYFEMAEREGRFDGSRLCQARAAIW